MSWYEVVNGSGDEDYNQRLGSVIGQKFGLFYFNEKNKLHIFVNINTRYSFIKKSIELDPIDALPVMTDFFVSNISKNKDYYDTGLEIENLHDFINKLSDGQGILFWFLYYNKYEKESIYKINEDKYLLKIILMERNEKYKKLNDKNVNKDLYSLFSNCIKTELVWKEMKNKRKKVYSSKIHKPLFKNNNLVYIYKSKIPDFLHMDYSISDTSRQLKNNNENDIKKIAFHRDESDKATVLDTKSETLMSLANSDKKILISGKIGDGKIELSTKIMKEAIKNNRNIVLLTTTKFDPYKNFIENEGMDKIIRFDLSIDYYNRRIVESSEDSSGLAEKLWAEIVTKMGNLRDPFLVIYNINEILPISNSGNLSYDNEFWSTFFKYYNASNKGIGILLLCDNLNDEDKNLRLYIDNIIKPYLDGNDVSFDVLK